MRPTANAPLFTFLTHLCLESSKSSSSGATVARGGDCSKRIFSSAGIECTSIPNSHHEWQLYAPLPTTAVPVRRFTKTETTTENEKSKSGNYWHATPLLHGRSYAGRRAYPNSDVVGMFQNLKGNGHKKSLRFAKYERRT